MKLPWYLKLVTPVWTSNYKTYIIKVNIFWYWKNCVKIWFLKLISKIIGKPILVYEYLTIGVVDKRISNPTEADLCNATDDFIKSIDQTIPLFNRIKNPGKKRHRVNT